jgi:copper/silver efflux system protein
MVGRMITAPLLSMLVIPAGYLLMRRRRSPQAAQPSAAPEAAT